MKVKGIIEVIKEVNNLKREKIIKDYAIGGGIAKNYYLEPQFTYDLDIFILIDGLDGFHNLYNYFRRKKYKIKNVFIVIKDVPVQFLPSFIHPLIKEGIENARKIRIDKLNTKVLTAEYLTATLFMSFRQKDKYAIKELLSFSDANVLKRLLQKFNTKEYPIYERFKEMAGGK